MRGPWATVSEPSLFPHMAVHTSVGPTLGLSVWACKCTGGERHPGTPQARQDRHTTRPSVTPSSTCSPAKPRGCSPWILAHRVGQSQVTDTSLGSGRNVQWRFFFSGRAPHLLHLVGVQGWGQQRALDAVQQAQVVGVADEGLHAHARRQVQLHPQGTPQAYRRHKGRNAYVRVRTTGTRGGVKPRVHA